MAPLSTASPSKKRSPKTIVTFLSGASSGCLSTLALQPFDVVKTRMQMSAAYNRSVHLQPALSLQHNASAVDTFRGIIRQDRVGGLWRGVAPSVMRNTLGVGVYFMALNAITARLSAPDGSLSDASTLYSGATARSIAVILLCPLSVVKTRMETVEYSNTYRGVFHALRTIAVQEGRHGLFSGLVPAVIRDAPFSAMYMWIYLRTKHVLGRAVGLTDTRSSLLRNHATTAPTQHVSASTTDSSITKSTPSSSSSLTPTTSETTSSDTPAPSPPWLIRSVNFASGAFGGGLATLITQPQDVVKTRMQLSPKMADGTSGRYNSVPDSVRRVFHEEGLYGFFRGSSPRFFKRILGSAITWMVFEEANAFYSELLSRSKDKDKER